MDTVSEELQKKCLKKMMYNSFMMRKRCLELVIIPIIGVPMSMYESFMVLFGFGTFLIALLALIVSLINRK
ncbi:putative holin-like toxin [Gracilibacillus saliphilus]